MSKNHHIQLSDVWVPSVVAGEKKSELRINDRDYQVGDTVSYEVVFRSAPDRTYILDKKFQITHVLNSNQCKVLEDGYCIISLKEIENEPAG